jgi:hypothetical protein
LLAVCCPTLDIGSCGGGFKLSQPINGDSWLVRRGIARGSLRGDAS